MAAVGDSYTPRVTRDGATGATTAVLDVVDGDDRPGPGGPAGQDSDDLAAFTAAPIILTGPGEWVLTWTFAGPGAGVVRQHVAVDPGDGVPGGAGFSFATTADLVRYTGRPVPAGARRALAAASAEIERITMTARYAVDPATGKAADPRVRQALADATCELLGWWAETGLETGARALFTSASIAGVSIGFGGANTKNPQADRVGPKVWTILMRAGLIGAGGVYFNG